jgi:hypothetical protein
MKKSILTLVTITSLSFGAMAQTTVGLTTSNTTVQGLSSVTLKAQHVTIDAPSAIILKTPSIQTAGSFNTTSSVTSAKLYTQGLDVGNSLINLTNSVNSKASANSVTNLTNRVTATEGDIVNLQNTKADKTDLVALDNKVNTEVNRLDGRIDALDTKVTSEISRVDSRIDATNTTVSNLTSTVEANKVEAKNYTDSKVGALDNKMTSEFKRVDTKIETEVNRLDSKIDRNDAAIRRDLRTETDRLTRADAELFAEMSNLGATMMAMGSMQSSAVYSPTKKGNVSFGSGVYRDSFAYAASVSYYVNPNTRISSTVAGGTKTKVGGGLGVSFGF